MASPILNLDRLAEGSHKLNASMDMIIKKCCKKASSHINTLLKFLIKHRYQRNKICTPKHGRQ